MTIEEKLSERLNAAASKSAIDEVTASLKHSLPTDYLQFLGKHNGGEGFVGEHYLILWKAEELIPLNRNYQVGEYAPGIFLFGSNGGGEGFGFDMHSSGSPVVVIPFIGMKRSSAITVASTFADLFSKLENNTELFCRRAT
jgi:hypothetical protein